MGGSSKSSSKDNKKAAEVAPQPLLSAYQPTIDPTVAAQLAQGGLLSSIAPMQNGMPVITKPSDIEVYLKSLGKTPVASASNTAYLTPSQTAAAQAALVQSIPTSSGTAAAQTMLEPISGRIAKLR